MDQETYEIPYINFRDTSDREEMVCMLLYTSFFDAYLPPLFFFCCCLIHAFLHFIAQNPRKRPTMEDSHVIIRSLGGNEDLSYIGVYDGHGGRGIVDYLESHLDHIIFEELSSEEEGDHASTPERLARLD